MILLVIVLAVSGTRHVDRATIACGIVCYSVVDNGGVGIAQVDRTAGVGSIVLDHLIANNPIVDDYG